MYACVSGGMPHTRRQPSAGTAQHPLAQPRRPCSAQQRTKPCGHIHHPCPRATHQFCCAASPASASPAASGAASAASESAGTSKLDGRTGSSKPPAAAELGCSSCACKQPPCEVRGSVACRGRQLGGAACQNVAHGVGQHACCLALALVPPPCHGPPARPLPVPELPHLCSLPARRLTHGKLIICMKGLRAEQKKACLRQECLLRAM